MPLFILGINHNTAPVEIRERVVFEPAELPGALSQLRELPGLAECMLLSTCNRTEIIGAGERAVVGEIRRWLARKLELDAATLAAFFELRDTDAARHLFRVASGLDSVVLGEPQIAGQLKEAYRAASGHGATGAILDRVCRNAFSTAKRVRTNTAIGENPVSVAYAVVYLAERLLDRFSQQTALLVGAGDTVELLARHLQSAGIGRLFIANRNVGNARRIAQRHGGFGLPLSDIDGTLPEADILVTSTASPEPIISERQMRSALARRRRRPVFIADIAVPRDIEPTVAELDDIYLYTVDDLHGVITENLASRRAAAHDAERIVDESVERFAVSERTLDAAPLITVLRSQSETLRDEVLAAALKRLDAHGAEAALEYLANTLTNKLLHKPSEALRKAAADADTDAIALARTLLAPDENTDE